MQNEQRPIFKSIDKRKFSASPTRKLFSNEEPAQNEKQPRDRSLLKEQLAGATEIEKRVLVKADSRVSKPEALCQPGERRYQQTEETKRPGTAGKKSIPLPGSRASYNQVRPNSSNRERLLKMYRAQGNIGN